MAALGTRPEEVGEVVKSCDEVETSMSMSMLWQVQRLVVLDIVVAGAAVSCARYCN